jgi:hypothetical protein
MDAQPLSASISKITLVKRNAMGEVIGKVEIDATPEALKGAALEAFKEAGVHGVMVEHGDHG